MEKELLREKIRGSFLGAAIGDILGAPVEGFPYQNIRDRFGRITDFLDSPRGYGRYTDDTEMALALAESLIENRGASAEACATKYAEFFDASRGYGLATHQILVGLKKGMDYRKTGLMVFREGSFGNGAAMRIFPVGLAYPEMDLETLRRVVYDAVMCTHVHPEAVDGGVIQAKAVGALSKIEHFSLFNPSRFLDRMSGIAKTEMMKQKMELLGHIIIKKLEDRDAVELLGNGVRASESVSCALLATARYFGDPEKAMINSVGFGGDTDTIGSMTGAQIGALHGTDWIPDRWFSNIENGFHGRDFIISKADHLWEVFYKQNNVSPD